MIQDRYHRLRQDRAGAPSAGICRQPHVELAGYYDLNTQRAQEMAAQYGGKVYESYFDLLNDPSIDAVSICVENRSHAEITTYALYAGKHVLCEKPMAVTLAECESMVAAAERNGKHLMIGHNMRFDPVHRKAKELLDSGIIGDIITFRTTMGNAGRRTGPWGREHLVLRQAEGRYGRSVGSGHPQGGPAAIPYRSEGHRDHRQGHDPEQAHATGAPITVDDNALCILRMSGGAVGTLAASWTVYGHECQSTCLYGTKGIMLIYNNNNPAAPHRRSGIWTAPAPPTTSRRRPIPASSTSLWPPWSRTGSRRSPAEKPCPPCGPSSAASSPPRSAAPSPSTTAM